MIKTMLNKNKIQVKKNLKQSGNVPKPAILGKPNNPGSVSVGTKKVKNGQRRVGLPLPKPLKEEEVDYESEEISGAEEENYFNVGGEFPDNVENYSGEEHVDEEDSDENQDEVHALESGDGEEDDNQSVDVPLEVPIEHNTVVPKKENVGKTDEAVGADKTIVVSNLPDEDEYTEKDLVAAFSKYGPIQTIKPIDSKPGSALISFKKLKAARKAVAEGNVTLKTNTETITLNLTRRKSDTIKKERDVRRDCTVFVKNLKKGITAEKLKKHFANCGDIDDVTLILKRGFGFITFKKPESVQAALKLHCTVLSGTTIGVYLHNIDNKMAIRDPKRTIFLRNMQKLGSVSKEKLEKVFENVGEIQDIDIVCGKNVLAFITFKDPESMVNAQKLDGSTVDGLQLEIRQYNFPTFNTNTSVFMMNVKPGVTEAEIRKFFEYAGEISNISIKNGFAVAKFADTDGFCKSFLLNEAILAGQPVFLEPFSEKKSYYIKKVQNLQKRKKTLQKKPESTPVKKPKIKSE